MTLNAGATSDQIAADKAVQEMGSVERTAPNERSPQVDNGDSAPGADDRYSTPPTSRADPPESRTETRRGPPLSPADQKRADMTARFRANREQLSAEAAAEADEIRQITREAMTPGEQEDLATEAAADRSREEAPPPRKHRVVVRGQEKELTDEELIAAAQKGLAGDDYLAEGRQVLDDAKALRAQIESERAALAAGKHPAGTLPDTQPTVQPQAPAPDEQPDEAAQALLREIQYGNPDDPETVKKLKTFMQMNALQQVPAVVAQELQRQREAAEVERGKAALAEFNNVNPDLIKDDFAMAIMERRLFAHFIEDLKQVGFDVSSLRDNNAIASIHMKMRAGGHPVRPIKELFAASRQDYVDWKAQQAPKPAAPNAPDPENQPPPRQPNAPRVEVNVNRDARRANIPTQPPRSSSPQRAPALPDNQPRGDSVEARSKVAQGIIAQRRALRNGGRAS